MLRERIFIPIRFSDRERSEEENLQNPIKAERILSAVRSLRFSRPSAQLTVKNAKKPLKVE
jgi:hypothetical protein